MNLLKTKINRGFIYIKQIHKELFSLKLRRPNDIYFYYVKGLSIFYKDISHQHVGSELLTDISVLASGKFFSVCELIFLQSLWIVKTRRLQWCKKQHHHTKFLLLVEWVQPLCCSVAICPVIWRKEPWLLQKSR